MKNYSNASRKPMMGGGKTTKGRSKMMAGGKATKGRSKMAAGGKMPMTMKDGKKVPAFAADGKGKMMAGGKATKGRAKMSSGGRTVSRTDASTAKSTPPKTGTDAQMQRMTNTVKSLMKDGLTRGIIGDMYRKAMKTQGSGSGRVSNKDMGEVGKRAMARRRAQAKKAPKDYGR